MKNVKALYGLVVLALAMSAPSIYAQDESLVTFVENGIIYEMNQDSYEKKLTITGYQTEPGAELTICTSVMHDGWEYLVGNIASGAFADCASIETLTIDVDNIFVNHGSVWMTISENAFEGCANLKKVNINDKIYNSQIEVDQNAFSGCTSLSSIYSTGADVVFKSGALDDSPVTTISFAGRLDFRESAAANVSKIVMEENPYYSTQMHTALIYAISVAVTSLKPDAEIIVESANVQPSISFLNEELVKSLVVYIPTLLYDSYKDLQPFASMTNVKTFAEAGLDESDYFESDGLVYSKTEGGCKLIYVSYEYLLGITDGRFVVPESAVCDGVELPVVALGQGVFAGKKDITEIELPSRLEIIGPECFKSTSVKSITLPESLKGIGAYAFAGTPLENVVIPESVEMVGARAFGNCSSLTSVVVEGHPVTGQRWIYGAGNEEHPLTVQLPNDYSYGVYFYLGAYVKDIVISPDTEVIGGAFTLINRVLEKVVIEDSETPLKIYSESFLNQMPELYIGRDIATSENGPYAVIAGSILNKMVVGQYVTDLTWLIGSLLGEGCIVEFNTAEPPSVNELSDRDYETVALYVPSDGLEAYKNHAVWGKFKNINAMASAVDVETTAADTVDVYTLTGIKVASATNVTSLELPEGIYIVVSDGKAVKMAL